MSLVTIRNKQTGEVKQVDSNTLGNYGLSSPSNNQNSQNDNKDSNVLGSITNALPNIGGILGSLLGGSGLVSSSVPISAAFSGTSRLGSVKKSIEQLQSGQPFTPGESALNAVSGSFGVPTDINTLNQAKDSALLTALGLVLAKGAGFVAHPIKSVVNKMVVEPLAKSPAVVDMGKVLGELYTTGKEQFAKKLLASAFPEAYNTLSSNVAAATADILPHQAAQNVAAGVAQPIGDIASQTLPVSEANILKTAAQRGVGNFYGEAGPPITELQKILASLLKQNIESAPGVSASVPIGNKIASLMYGVPDTLTGLTDILPGRAGGAIRRIGGLPIQLAQGILGNPANRYLLPVLTQLLGGGGGQ